jgi:hypothetical protein
VKAVTFNRSKNAYFYSRERYLTFAENVNRNSLNNPTF